MSKTIRMSRSLLSVPGSGIRDVMSKSAALKAAGKDVINWHIGRPDFDTPKHIKEACWEALQQGHVHYAPAAGIPGLREALAKRAEEEYKIAVDPERMIVCNGGMEAVTAVFHSLLEQGEGNEVIIPTPNWPNMKWAVVLAGGVPVEIPLVNGILTAKAISSAVTDNTKAVVLASPANPLGSVTHLEELQRIAKVVEEKDLLVISDETYTRLYYGEGSVAPSILSVEGMEQRSFAVSTFSKTYAMDGWRLGWALCPDVSSASAVAKTRYYFSSCSPTFTQYAGIAALTDSQECVAEMLAEYDARRRILMEGLANIPGVKLPSHPLGAYYVFPDLSAFGGADGSLAKYLLDEHHIALVDGGVFGEEGQGHVRIAYSCSTEECRRGVERLHHALDSLKGKFLDSAK
eukprot:symbB.v1.2.036755.t1/scaffold5224.1/size29657/2